MKRPCFLVVDREYPGSISTRKMVIETAKFNVLTAYDTEEGLECLRRFPNVDGVVVNLEATGGDQCKSLVEHIRKIVPDMRVVVTSAGGYRDQNDDVYHVDSFDPKALLECLQSLESEATAEIRERDNGITR